MYQAALGNVGIGVAYGFKVAGKQLHRGQLFQCNKPGAQAVVHIVIVVGDLVGEVGDLRLKRGVAAV